MGGEVNETVVERDCNMNCRSEDCLKNFDQEMCFEEDGLKGKYSRDGKVEVTGQQKWHVTFDVLKRLSSVLFVTQVPC
jgi:hypothetical protein